MTAASTDRRRVVVTGLGATTPLGGDVATTWAGLLEGRSGVSTLTDEWALSLPARLAARIAVEPLDVLERVEARTLDLLVDPDELEKRKEGWAPPPPRYPTGVLGKYARLVGSAAQGAVCG